MIVSVNGEERELPEGVSVGDVLGHLGGSARGVAVVVAGSVVPRSEWASRRLAAGEPVEIITAVQGG